jgi:hypothetical protein
MDRRRRPGIVTVATLAVAEITDLAFESNRGHPNRIRGMITVATVRGGPHSMRIRHRSHGCYSIQILKALFFLAFTCIRRLQMYSEKTQLASILKWLVMN